MDGFFFQDMIYWTGGWDEWGADISGREESPTGATLGKLTKYSDYLEDYKENFPNLGSKLTKRGNSLCQGTKEIVEYCSCKMLGWCP